LSIKGLREAVEREEKRRILLALQETQGKRREAARLLEVSAKTLLEKMKRYGIPFTEGRPACKL